jgi:hypothetical protein
MQAGMFDVKTFDAKGDGKTDDTAAIQKAVDEASKIQGTVFFPPGIYMSSMLRVPSCVTLQGNPTWGYKWPGGTVLRLLDPKASCLIDITGTTTVRLVGLALDGVGLGTGVHGIFVEGKTGHGETSHQIERTWIGNFSGAGASLVGAWAFWIRENVFFQNGGDGVTLRGTDIYVHENIIIGNRGYGLNATTCGAMTVAGNRIEWNAKGGLYLESSMWQINNNHFDRSGGPAVTIRGSSRGLTSGLTLSGNLFTRSGARVPWGSNESCHVLIERVNGLTLCNNVCTAGQNDDGRGPLSPAYGVVYSHLRRAIIQNNAMFRGAIKQSFLDLGGCDKTLVIRDNPGAKTARKLPKEPRAPKPPTPPPSALPAARPSCGVVGLKSAPKMNGNPLGSTWETVPALDPFSLVIERTVATQQTEVKMGCHRDQLFLAITCWESRMEALVAECRTKDGTEPVYTDDAVDIFLAPPGGMIRHLVFNSLGAMWAARIEDGRETVDADLGWRVATRRCSNRWTAEVAIPLKALTSNGKIDGTEWGFNVCRSERPWSEMSSWAPLSQLRFFAPDEFGKLKFA